MRGIMWYVKGTSGGWAEVGLRGGLLGDRATPADAAERKQRKKEKKMTNHIHSYGRSH